MPRAATHPDKKQSSLFLARLNQQIHHLVHAQGIDSGGYLLNF
jgi:hypothetical protein